VIYVDGSGSDDDERSCRERFELLTRREWTYLLAFVDQVEEVPATAGELRPQLRKIGVALDLPDPAHGLDEQAVRADLTALVAAVSNLAREAAIEFVIEYREEAVGFLDGGPRDTRFLADYFGEHEHSRGGA
jgi:hypothetical protein